MNENERKLEAVLLEVIERIAREPMSEDEVQVLPQLAHALIRLWEMH